MTAPDVDRVFATFNVAAPEFSTARRQAAGQASSPAPGPAIDPATGPAPDTAPEPG